MVDQHGRNIEYMRISVTDRCNLRCVYCMPEEGVETVPHDEVLTYEEILRIVRAGVSLGIKKLRVTGGEPLVRRDVAGFIRRAREVEGIESVVMTTNGVLFPEQGRALQEAGLNGVNFSLDTLDAGAFAAITRASVLDKVLEGVSLALALGLTTRINCVPVDPLNTASLIEVAGLARDLPLDVRFIEMMPIGPGARFQPVGSDAVLARLAEAYGRPVPSARPHGSGPARYYDFPGFMGSIGFISAITGAFCESCNRVRLTAEGTLKLCLCHDAGVDLKPLLRGGASDETLKTAMREAIYQKPMHHDFCEPEREAPQARKMVQIGG